MTDTLAPPFAHTAACALTLDGLAVRSLFAAGWEAIDSGQLAAEAQRLRDGNARPCDCGRLALSRTETSLRLARAAGRAWREKFPMEQLRTRKLAERVDTLVARRDAIRAALR